MAMYEVYGGAGWAQCALMGSTELQVWSGTVIVKGPDQTVILTQSSPKFVAPAGSKFIANKVTINTDWK